MALNASRCSSRECNITGYTVDLTLNSGDVTFEIVDDCNTLTSQRLMKLVFQEVAALFYADNDLTESVCGTNCECGFGPAGWDFYFADKRAVMNDTGLSSLAEDSYTITLPPTE